MAGRWPACSAGAVPGRAARPGRTHQRPSDQAAAELLAAAETHLGRLTRRQVRRGRVDRLVVEAAQDADLLVVARDGDRHRLGPASLGPAPASSSTTPPARCCWSGPTSPPRSTPSHRHPRTPIARTPSTCDLAGRRAWLLTGAEARVLAPFAAALRRRERTVP